MLGATHVQLCQVLSRLADIEHYAGKIICGGRQSGSTLIFDLVGGGTLNIPIMVTDNTETIDLTNLTPAQQAALSEALRGELVRDLSGTPHGYLLSL